MTQKSQSTEQEKTTQGGAFREEKDLTYLFIFSYTFYIFIHSNNNNNHMYPDQRGKWDEGHVEGMSLSFFF